MKKLILSLICMMMLSCTQQEMARSYGGSTTETLPKGQKLVTITWKETHLWYLTRPMHPGEKAETYTFKESSAWGIVEGTVTVKEQD